MHEQLPPLQVVVVAYGDPGALERCLTPLVSSYPVTVIDNSSSTITRGVAERLGAAYDDPGENLGFGTAVNRVLARLSLPDVDVFLVNPDAVVEPDTVEAMRRALHEGPKVACVAPFQRSPGSTKPSPVRWPFPTPAGAWTEAVGLGRLRHRWDYVIASILCMNGAALSEVGGFDEGFFLYAEEADWERRACERGWRVSYLEDVQALHVGAATDSSPERQEIRFHAGMEHYVRKWHGAAGWRIYQAATVLTALRRALVRRGSARSQSLHLARLYTAGPTRAALHSGAIPDRSEHVPRLGDSNRAGPVRVLLVDSSGYIDLGGASTVLNEAIARMDRSRFSPVLACLSPGGWPEEVRRRGTPAYSFPRTRLRSPANVAKVVGGLRSVVRSHTIDLVHASENSSLLYASLVGRITRTPVIWHIHSPLQARSREERLVAHLLRHLLPAHIVFTSPGALAKTKAFSQVPSSVLLPGVDVERCRGGDGQRGRSALGIPDQAEVVSMFARVDPMKGQKDFVECLARLSESHPRLYGVMCGPGDRESAYWRGLDAIADEHGLSERLLMPGYVSSPLKEDVVAASDVVVHPSHAESFGLAILEAMAASRPVVAADADGPRILIENGVDGKIVPPGDPEALAAVVGRLLDDPASRQEMGARAGRAAESYPVEETVRRMENLWESILVSKQR